ncbi:MAG: S-layer homology domain-containing protein [Fusobacteriaceae bacterium]
MRSILLVVLIFSTISYGQLKYEDITKDHWAYTAIENLVNKGIIKKDAYNFKGESSLKRYDFAYSMSKLLNKIELEKVDKRDLLVLEKLVSEFAKELTKFGFDIETFNVRIASVEEDITKLKLKVNENEKIIQELLKRLEKLEK